MKSTFEIASLVIVGIAVAILVFAFLGMFVWLIGFFILIAGVAWAFGAKLKVTRDGREIGYIRWTKFHPKD